MAVALSGSLHGSTLHVLHCTQWCYMWLLDVTCMLALHLVLLQCINATCLLHFYHWKWFIACFMLHVVYCMRWCDVICCMFITKSDRLHTSMLHVIYCNALMLHVCIVIIKSGLLHAQCYMWPAACTSSAFGLLCASLLLVVYCVVNAMCGLPHRFILHAICCTV